MGGGGGGRPRGGGGGGAAGGGGAPPGGGGEGLVHGGDELPREEAVAAGRSHGALDELVHLLRDAPVGVGLARGADLPRLVGLEDVLDRGSLVGRGPRQQVEEGGAEGVGVGLLVLLLPLEDLRRHIVGGARAVRGLAHDLGVAEVHEDGAPRLVEDHVGGLHVPVEDALPVGVVQGLRHLPHRQQRGLGVHGPLVVHDLQERPARHEVHDDEEVAAVLHDVEHAHDAGMVELRQRAGLVDEALPRLRGGAGVLAEHLDGHVLLEGQVGGVEDRGGPAPAHGLADPAAAEGLPGEGVVGCGGGARRSCQGCPFGPRTPALRGV